MATLNYSGEQTVDAQSIQSLISSLQTLHQDDSDITVSNASLRFEDDGSLRVLASLEADGDLGRLDTLQDLLQQQAADLGFQTDDTTDSEETDPTDGVELL